MCSGVGGEKLRVQGRAIKGHGVCKQRDNEWGKEREEELKKSRGKWGQG